MCSVSVIMDYGRGMPIDSWTWEKYQEFQRLIAAGETFDRKTGQPDCVDPLKAKIIETIEEYLNQKGPQ
jgi:hypothetical protein